MRPDPAAGAAARLACRRTVAPTAGKVPGAITHAPGHRFVTGVPDSDLQV